MKDSLKNKMNKKIGISFFSNKPQITVVSAYYDKAKREYKAEFETAGIKDTEVLNDKLVYLQDKQAGIIRKDSKSKSQYIELFDDIYDIIKGKLGLSFINLYTENNCICKGDTLYTDDRFAHISDKIEYFLAETKMIDVNDLYFTLHFSENELINYIGKQECDINIIVYCCKETDKLKIGNGCGLVISDDGYIMPLDIQKKITSMPNAEKIKFTPCFIKGDSILKKVSVAFKSHAIGVVVPIKNINTKYEECSISDIENAVSLSCKIASLLQTNDNAYIDI